MPDDTQGTPRWLKVFAIVAVILLLVIAIGLATGLGGPGGHGPGRHTGPGEGAPPTRVAEERAPAGGVLAQWAQRP